LWDGRGAESAAVKSGVKFVKSAVNSGKKWLLWKAAQKGLDYLIKKGKRFHLHLIKAFLRKVAKKAIYKGGKAVARIISQEHRKMYFLRQMNRSRVLQWVQIVIPSEVLRLLMNVFKKKNVGKKRIQLNKAAKMFMTACACLQPINPSHASLANHPQATKVLVSNTQRKWLEHNQKERAPAELVVYLLRASATYFQNKKSPLYKWRMKRRYNRYKNKKGKWRKCKLGSTRFFCENEESKALQFVSCVDEHLKSNAQKEKVDTTYDRKQQTLKEKCKKYQNTKNILPQHPQHQNNIGKLVWQGCLATFKVSLSRCTTCCCRNGLAVGDVRTSLIYGSQQSCAQWFSSVDGLSRSVSTVWRMLNIGALMYTCSTSNTAGK